MAKHEPKKGAPAEGAAAPATPRPRAEADPGAPAPAPDDSPVYRRVKEKLPEALAEGSHLDRGDLVLKALPERVHDLGELLRDDEELACDYLSCLTAVDYPERPRRFDVVWTLCSTSRGHRFHVAAEVAEGEPVPTVRDLWRTADWQEREVWDMFGIPFAGHPDLRRILLPDWWEGYPLRKDYPVTGRGEHEKVIEQCLRPKV